MADSDFWRDLAKEFSTADPAERIALAWTHHPDSGSTDFILSPNPIMTEERVDSIIARIRALATRAGYQRNPGCASPDEKWFEELRQHTGPPEFHGLSDGKNPTGRVASVCEASARRCRQLEVLALASEQKPTSQPIAASTTETPKEDIDPLMKFRVILQFDPEDITEIQARTIWAKLEIIDSRRWQGAYQGQVDSYGLLYQAFDDIAEILVDARTPDELIDGYILNLVEAYSTHKRWQSSNSAACKDILRNKTNEWRNRRDLLALEKSEKDQVSTKAIKSDADGEGAVAVLESKPGFAKANSKIFDQIDKLKIADQPGSTLPGSSARMVPVTKAFDIRAGQLVKLVDDMPSQKAFVSALVQICRVAWVEFTDIPVEEMNQGSPEAKRIWNGFLTKARQWENKGLKKLTRLSTNPKVIQKPSRKVVGSPTEKTVSSKRKRRSAMIESPSAVRKIEAHLTKVRDSQGIGITDFVGIAGISERTLRNVRKTSKARPDTFRAIAKAMQTTFESLISQ